jgi:pimeloyl-ACP methyl ester carboxylesterase
MGRLTTADGRALAYRRVGSGRPLVCHPGGPGFSAFYFGELAGLGEQLGLILLDPRGTGGSTAPTDPRAYQLDDYVSDLEELRIGLELDRMQLLGHSHGGIVAVAYAARHPQRVDRLILASTLARFSPEQRAAMDAGIEKRSDEPWYDDARAALAAEEAGEFSTDEELAELAMREFPLYFARFGDRERAYLESLRSDVPNPDPLRLFNLEIVETFDLRPELAQITASTLVITGEDDFITGPVCAEELAEGIAGAELVVLPETGHFIFYEAPIAFRDAVLSFLGAATPA